MRELESAMEIFVKLKTSRAEIGSNSYSINVGLAFLNSCVGEKKRRKSSPKNFMPIGKTVSWWVRDTS
ncbi:hypothetical protein QUB08_14585 [Microcoleus sp. BR0-C5]|uniref:hypothetical protein n=1 Tax=Microcoleus sp. BR0-C5 TaxID=2818713 RepID=UPI002FD551C0